jgi:hypothetical protein
MILDPKLPKIMCDGEHMPAARNALPNGIRDARAILPKE